jgi:hypothetical protein
MGASVELAGLGDLAELAAVGDERAHPPGSRESVTGAS